MNANTIIIKLQTDLFLNLDRFNGIVLTKFSLQFAVLLYNGNENNHKKKSNHLIYNAQSLFLPICTIETLKII